MIWAGNVLRVSVRKGPGKWTNTDAIREVYAIKDEGTSGVTALLVTDDEQKLQWVDMTNCSVPAPPVRT